MRRFYLLPFVFHRNRIDSILKRENISRKDDVENTIKKIQFIFSLKKLVLNIQYVSCTMFHVGNTRVG